MTSQANHPIIRAAVVGTGFIGPAHIEALRRNNIMVSGLVESTQEACETKASRLGIPHAYANFEAMLEDPNIDVVHLTTPNYLHYQHAKAALQAGKHVLCEKPLAMNSHQSAELVRLAAEKRRLNAVNFNLRFYPLVHHARSMVQAGELGDLFIMQGSYLQDWLLLPTDWNWRLDPKLGGTLRAVADIGSHWLDLITFITDQRIESVMADFSTFLPVRKKPTKPLDTYSGKLLTPDDYIEQPIHTEDYATILLHYSGGARGVLTVSQVSAGRKNSLSFEIDGSQAALAWNSEKPNELWVGRRDGPNQVIMKDPSLLSDEARAIAAYPGGHNEGFPDTFKQLAQKVYQYLRNGNFDAKPDFPTFADGHYELILSEAIERSAKEGRWVDVMQWKFDQA